MAWKRFLSIVSLGAGLIFAVYAAINPTGIIGQTKCCVAPTKEEEYAEGPYSPDPTVAKFQMTVSSNDETDFDTDYDGEYSPETGKDSCYDEDPNSGFQPLVKVTTPLPGYYWIVGQVGTWDGKSSILNGVNPSPAYNTYGYDGVGYSQAAVSAYRGALRSKGKLPCGTELYQQMKMYCKANHKFWPYTVNDLTAQINTTYVVDCKNSVCATLYH